MRYYISKLKTNQETFSISAIVQKIYFYNLEFHIEKNIIKISNQL